MVVLLFRRRRLVAGLRRPLPSDAREWISPSAHAPCANLHRVVDWNDVRHFLAVFRAGSLAGAARALGVEHTTVGRRIAALEESLGVRLFARTPEGLVATEDANAIVETAERMERAADEMKSRVGGGDAKLEGTVRVATSEAFSGFLVKALPALRE